MGIKRESPAPPFQSVWLQESHMESSYVCSVPFLNARERQDKLTGKEMANGKKRSLDLYQVIAENAPDAIKAGEIKNHFGRKVAIVCLACCFQKMSYVSG
jgi:hypothetical protein